MLNVCLCLSTWHHVTTFNWICNYWCCSANLYHTLADNSHANLSTFWEPTFTRAKHREVHLENLRWPLVSSTKRVTSNHFLQRFARHPKWLNSPLHAILDQYYRSSIPKIVIIASIRHIYRLSLHRSSASSLSWRTSLTSPQIPPTSPEPSIISATSFHLS